MEVYICVKFVLNVVVSSKQNESVRNTAQVAVSSAIDRTKVVYVKYASTAVPSF